MAEERNFPIWLPGQPLAAFIDYTHLVAESGAKELISLCDAAESGGFHSVCVNGGWVRLCRERLGATSVKVSAVVGYPLGAQATRAKAFEAAAALEDGASEIDMVIAVGKLRDGDIDAVERDISAVVQAMQGGALIKVIVETGYLTEEQIRIAGKLAAEAGADFVQTCTGYGGRGASVSDVRLLREAVGETIGVKASGGIRDTATAIAFLNAGANRIGTSAGVAVAMGGR
ncbi:deoxyribose-phosphate aldolase [Cohnella yongneupensis]|uniref:Deoxyribose-phosphate aldolase n=1 Tax=Cohnella yongneupensis TaxID=425006 RepID=A0ABW0R4G9_9BACL